MSMTSILQQVAMYRAQHVIIEEMTLFTNPPSHTHMHMVCVCAHAPCATLTPAQQKAQDVKLGRITHAKCVQF